MTERTNGTEIAKQLSTPVIIASQDEAMSQQIGFQLRDSGFQTAAIGKIDQMPQEPNGAVLILDERLLNGDLQPLETLNASRVPTIVIGDRAQETQRQVALLLAGADYYLDTNCSPDLIPACIKAIQRRLAKETPVPPYYKVGDVEIALAEGRFLKGGKKVSLTPTERGLVACLLQDPTRVHSRIETLKVVWGPEYDAETDYLKVFVRRVRQKLGPDFIETVPGIGHIVKQGGITQKVES